MRMSSSGLEIFKPDSSTVAVRIAVACRYVTRNAPINGITADLSNPKWYVYSKSLIQETMQ